ncbi:hypothetical protein GCM10010320_21690 [Streptomyces caelestis]|nr:hypothetical protein GCM10010320_21690 [Streptomyces caelestis]
MRGRDLLRNTAPHTALAGNHRCAPVCPCLGSSRCNKWPGGDGIPPDPTGSRRMPPDLAGSLRGEAEDSRGAEDDERSGRFSYFGYLRPIASQAALYFAVQMSDSL